MKLAVISFTKAGEDICRKLENAFLNAGESCTGYSGKRMAAVPDSGLKPVIGSLSEWTGEQFSQMDGLVFVGAAGIAVRLIAPYLKDKLTDPAVVVVDEAGQFSISLLSGHVGGANRLAERVAEILGAMAVVTTASDVRGRTAVDVWAKDHGLVISDRKLAKEAAAALLDGEKVGFFSDIPMEAPDDPGYERDRVHRINVCVTCHLHPASLEECGEVLRLIPKTLVLGVGCRKGTPAENVEAAVRETLKAENLDIRAVAALASIDLKKEETGLLQLAETLKIPFVTYSSEELASVQGDFTESGFVRQVTGVGNVCERSALFCAGTGGRLIVKKQVHPGVTVAVAEKRRDFMMLRHPSIVIFGGTSEGRELAEYAEQNGIPVLVSVVSGYGESLLTESSMVQVHTGALDEEKMRAFLRGAAPELVLDATHPYARVVTEQVAALCRELAVPYRRILRASEEDKTAENSSPVFVVDSLADAVNCLKQDDRPVLLTTGSKELEIFASDPAWKDRIYARVLPDSQVLKKCEELGIRGAHVIAMQGPFSTELNCALLRTVRAGWLVTKEAGKRGGFAEKMEAARQCGVSVVVIRRPVQEEGISLDEAKAQMDAYRCARDRGTRKQTETGGTDGDLESGNNPVAEGISMGRRTLSLIGMGMGGGTQLTLEALEAIRRSDVVFGARRMLADIVPWIGEKHQEPFYQPEKILDWLEEKNGCQNAAVICSGDTGFYSGSGSMLREIRARWGQEEESPFSVTVYPGISSVSALAARYGISWEHACLASAHGRDCDVAALVKEQEQVFLLLDGSRNLKTVCKILTDAGMGRTKVYAGVRMGYEDEQKVSGRAQELVGAETDDLTAVFLERE